MDNNNKKGAFEKFQDYLDTAKGRTLLNYLYSWGAAIVILGALFKLTHISGADLMLFLGMPFHTYLRRQFLLQAQLRMPVLMRHSGTSFPRRSASLPAISHISK